MNQEIITEYFNKLSNIEDIQMEFYSAAAATSIKCNKQNSREIDLHKRKTISKTPTWRSRIGNRVDNLRADIDRLTEYVNYNSLNKIII